MMMLANMLMINMIMIKVLKILINIKIKIVRDKEEDDDQCDLSSWHLVSDYNRI